MTAKYEMPTVRFQLLEIIHGAYPVIFGALTPTKLLGEAIFPAPNPHPNEVLSLFVQQGFTSALPIAYYMAARRGVDSLIDGHLPQSAVLPPEVFRSAMKGLMALREIELSGVHRLVLGLVTSNPCSSTSCPSRRMASSSVSGAHQKVIERITAPPLSGTKVLEVYSLGGICDSDRFCEVCVNEWDTGYAEVRRRAWNMLPKVFGLRR